MTDLDQFTSTVINTKNPTQNKPAMESVLATWPSPAINGLILDDSSITTNATTITINNNTFPQSPIRSPATLYDQPEPSKLSSKSRAELAENLLKDIEFGRDFQYPQSEFLDEESYNLELFQDLDAACYDLEAELTGNTPPLSPVPVYEISPQSSPPAINEFPDETFNQLNAEFQKILDSLPESNFEVNEDAIDLIENIMDLNEEEDSMDYTSFNGGEEDDASQNLGDEVEIVTGDIEDDNSSNSSNSYITNQPAVTTYVPNQIHEIEVEESDVSEKILDALMKGDLATANSYIPKTSGYSQVPVVQTITVYPVTLSASTSASNSTGSQAASTKSRGASRAPGPKTNQKKPRLPPKVDRVQRKKEQNKTAATRYREKKKVLASIVSQQEEELSKINSELLEEKNDLGKQILILKQLLRDVMKAKKESNKRSPHRR